MVSDTMETDMRGATDLGCKSILVLTGSSTIESLKNYPLSPTRVVESVASLARELRGQPARTAPLDRPRFGPIPQRSFAVREAAV